ncbi:MAG: A24 family peptidase [Myxococcota bacterium]
MDIAPELVVLFVGLAVAAASDLYSGTIPNALTFPMMILGVAIGASRGDPWTPLVGCAAAFAIHFPLFAAGVVRGGDAKLLMGLGACMGWRSVLEATAWFAIAYVPVALVVLIARGRLGNLVATARYVAAKSQGQDPGPAPEPTVLRTAPVIAVAGLATWATDWLAWPR